MVGGDLAAPHVSAEPQGRAGDATLRINGQDHRLADLDAHTTLLEALRDHLQMTGTKKGCGGTPSRATGRTCGCVVLPCNEGRRHAFRATKPIESAPS